MITNDTLYEIFSHLNQTDLSKCAQTCRQWNTASKNSRFYPRLEGIPHLQLIKCCRQGLKIQLIGLLHNYIFDEYDFNWGLYEACQGKHIEMIELMIKSGANNFNMGLEGACIGGHLEIVELMVFKEADNFNVGLKTACRKGQKEIAELMIEKGADNFNAGLHYACKNRHKELVKLMINSGADWCCCNKSMTQHLQ